MILSELLQYDLSGEKPGFKRTNMRYAVFTNKQVLYLKEPAYANSIVVYKADENFNKEATPLTQGVEYSISGIYESTCRDFDAESHARVMCAAYPYATTADTVAVEGKTYYKHNTVNERFYKVSDLTAGTILQANTYYERISGGWNAKLISKIQMLITGNASNPTHVIVEYQAYKNTLNDVYGDGEGPLYSPGLMRTVIERINELERTTTSSIVAESQTFSSCLEVDLTGIKEENFIKQEKHVVDTTADKFVIRPINGSFYNYTGDNLKLTFVSIDGSTTKTLIRDTGDGSGDYDVVGLNYAKTAMSEPTGGVYEFIALKQALVGYVFVDYHAFGGEVSVADITQIKDDLVSLRQTIDNTNLLTTDNLPKSVLIANMIDRLDALEHQLQHYRTQTFIYTSLENSDKWVNIAYVDSHPWMDSAPVPDHEVGKFQIQIQQMNSSTASIQTGPTEAVNSRTSRDLELQFSYEPIRNAVGAISRLVIRAKDMHMDTPAFEENGGLYGIKQLTPKFRVITNAVKLGETVPSFNNGVVVQMSIVSAAEYKYIVTVSDKTAAKSPWTLVDSLNDERDDASEFCQFNNATWSIGTGSVSNIIPVYGTGLILWRGALPVTLFNEEYENQSAIYGSVETNSNSLCIFDKQSINSIEYDAIKKIRVQVYDRHTCGYITAETAELQRIINDTGSNTVGVSGSIMYFLGDMCEISVKIYDSSSTEHKNRISVCGYCGSNSVACDRFYLTGIVIL